MTKTITIPTQNHFGAMEIRAISTVVNNPMGFSKPMSGGFWTAPATENGSAWITFCEENGMDVPTQGVKIAADPDARIYIIDSLEDYESLLKNHSYTNMMGKEFIDFESVSKQYDAIYLTEQGQEETVDELWAWDVESCLWFRKAFNILETVEFPSATDETSAAGKNTKGEEETMTTTNTNTTKQENTKKEDKTITNKHGKVFEGMEVTTNEDGKVEVTLFADRVKKLAENAKKVNKSLYFDAEGNIREDNKCVFLNEADLAVFQKHTATVAQILLKSGIQAPLLSTFIGTGNSHLIADGRRNRFVIVRDGKEAVVKFGAPLATQIINYSMVILPTIFPGFVETDVYTKLAGMNLKGRLTAKLKVHGKLTRDNVLQAALNMNDIFVVRETVLVPATEENPAVVKKTEIGKLMSLETDFVKENIVTVTVNEEGEETYTFNKDIKFYIAKDTEVANLNSPYSLYQKNSGSLATTRFAKTQGKKIETIKVTKDYTVNGVVQQIEEEQKALVLPELCTFDGSATLPFGEALNAVILKAVFAEVKVVDSKDGKLDVNKEVFCTYNTYVKSMSQARSNGAVGFQTLEQVIDFLIGTGSDATAYGKEVKDSTTGEKVMEVGKAYKRFMLAGSNGLAPKKGLLSRFGKNIKVEETVEYRVGGKLVKNDDPRIEEKGRNDVEKIIRITIKNKKKEVISMVIIDDFYSEIKPGQNFILNVLDLSNAFKKVAVFKHWNDRNAVESILKRNLTDGGGYVSGRIIEALREAGVINSFDAFQLRVSNAVKGAVIQFDELAAHYGADIVLTKGMVKSEVITADLQENGFQLFVVGQRKDGVGGNWLASQALQQMGLNKDELLLALKNSITFHIDAIETQMVDNLLALADATDEESENELASIDFLRVAKEVGDVMDEQYIKDELISLAVKKLNKVLDSKFFTPQARTRYMFSDPIAIYNAAIEGRHLVTEEDAVLDAYEVICPSTDASGKYFMETGKALSVRYPVTVIHEIPVVTAIAHPLYKKYVERGIWQGCTFFDIKSWVVAQQAGADHDGDMSIIIFDQLFVNARIRVGKELFGGLEVLPFIDAYVKEDENGKPVVTVDKDGKETTEGSFGTGCPTYVVPGNKKTEPRNTVINGFKVVGDSIYFKDADFKGENGAARRRDFVEVIALLAKDITLNTIESSLIGLIANRAMILTDLITAENALNPKQRLFMEQQMMVLTTAGRWEIDRPKHGGAYLEMPIIKDLFGKFESRYFTKEEMSNNDDWKRAKLAEEKGLFRLLHEPQFSKKSGALYGFKVVKPNWLSTQKDESGVVRSNSLFEVTLESARFAMERTCEDMKKKHSANTAENNLVVLVRKNMEADAQTIQIAKAKAAVLYEAFNAKEKARKDREDAFVKEKTDFLAEIGAFGKKELDLMTKAKKKSKVRDAFPVKMAEYKNGRELHEAQLRKAMYEAAKELNVDVRVMVGALYLVINEQRTNVDVSWYPEGREFVFAVSNGNINLPFTTFKEEMSALLVGKISKTCFIPMNLSFTLLKSNLIEGVATAAPSVVKEQVNARVLVANEAFAGKTKQINRPVSVAVKCEEINGEVRQVMYILKKGVQVADETAVTNEHAVFKAFAPQGMMNGLGQRTVTTVKYHAERPTAVITFA